MAYGVTERKRNGENKEQQTTNDKGIEIYVEKWYTRNRDVGETSNGQYGLI